MSGNDCQHKWENTGLFLGSIPKTLEQICILCGKRRFNQQEIERGELTDLGCDRCQKPMYMLKSEGDVVFRCSACEQCWQFTGDRVSSTLATLWPSGMEETSTMYRERYLPAWLKEREFIINARFIGGILSEAQKNESLRECRAVFDRWYIEHPIQKHLWWKIWDIVSRGKHSSSVVGK